MLLTIQRSKLNTMAPQRMPTGRNTAQPWCGKTSDSAMVSDAVAALAVSRITAPIELYLARSGTVRTEAGSAPATCSRKFVR